jgi:hypothetical protein
MTRAKKPKRQQGYDVARLIGTIEKAASTALKIYRAVGDSVVVEPIFFTFSAISAVEQRSHLRLRSGSTWRLRGSERFNGLLRDIFTYVRLPRS